MTKTPASKAREPRDGVLIPVRAQPGASRNQILCGPDGILKVRVTATAVDGAANKALIKLLSKSLGIPKSRIRIHSGGTSRNKVIFVGGISAAEVESRVRSRK